MGKEVKYVVRLTMEERRTLESLVAEGRAAADRLLRARMLLKADVGQGVGRGRKGSQFRGESAPGQWLRDGARDATRQDGRGDEVRRESGCRGGTSAVA